MRHDKKNILPLGISTVSMRKGFLGWQCRLRQLSMREGEGRPSEGMRPTLKVAGQDAGTITLVMVKENSDESTAAFRHLVKRTEDPKERFEAALRHMQSSYFQDPLSFSDQLTAVFGIDAAMPKQLAGRTDCVLTFKQFAQVYQLTCEAMLLAEDDPAFQATYWHNALFNPSMPGDVQILAFKPEWTQAKAEPVPK
ncbi:MAG: hypothetical protein ACRBM6_24925 [Geminicoccales bacterium]